jgi:hypothetical protein
LSADGSRIQRSPSMTNLYRYNPSRSGTVAAYEPSGWRVMGVASRDQPLNSPATWTVRGAGSPGAGA